MPKPHPIELRERVVAHVEKGHSHRATARHFSVSIKFVNDMIKLKRETGGLAPRHNPRNTGNGKLFPHKDWIRSRVEQKMDITLRQLCLELKEKFGLVVGPSPVSNLLRSLGFTHKKRLFTLKNNIALM